MRSLVIAAVLLAATPALSTETIVGTWAPDPTRCTPVAGLVSIGPKSLTTDELSCRFTDVSRDADVVTWHGTCSDGTTRTPSTVVAALHGDLTTSVNRVGWSPNLRRCRR